MNGFQIRIVQQKIRNIKKALFYMPLKENNTISTIDLFSKTNLKILVNDEWEIDQHVFQTYNVFSGKRELYNISICVFIVIFQYVKSHAKEISMQIMNPKQVTLTLYDLGERISSVWPKF